jgi:hypothetical protein
MYFFLLFIYLLSVCNFYKLAILIICDEFLVLCSFCVLLFHVHIFAYSVSCFYKLAIF